MKREKRIEILHRIIKEKTYAKNEHLNEEGKRLFHELHQRVMQGEYTASPTKQWILQIQERQGTYRFNGRTLITKSIQEDLLETEIKQIYENIQMRVEAYGGCDYLQCFHEKGGNRKIFCIDQLNNDREIYSEEKVKEFNYWTILFSHEY